MKLITAKEAYLYAYDKGLKFPNSWNVSPHFTWNEVFKNEPEENVPCLILFRNAELASMKFEKARCKIGKSFNIHRWYSSVQHNKAAGSKAKLGCHMLALAIDFDILGQTSEQGRQSLLKCDVDIRIEAGTEGWNHIDTGNPYEQNGFRWGLFNP